MSGGSYDYLCFKDAYQIVSHRQMLRSMADRLTELGHDDAAGETEDIIAAISQCIRIIDTRIQRLSDVWRAVEWYDSGDSGKESIDAEIAIYRGQEKW